MIEESSLQDMFPEPVGEYASGQLGEFSISGGGEVDRPTADENEDEYEQGFDFEDAGGENSWEASDKPDTATSNAPTSAPATAQGYRDTQGISYGGNSTGGNWPAKPETPRSVAQPAHQGEWESNTNDHLNRAKLLIQKAHKHSQDNDGHIHSSRKRGKNAKEGVYTMIKKKMSMTTDLIKALEDRHESVEDTIRQVGECLFQLQRAHRSKWAPLNVCERRLELRDTRPLQELVRDHTQEALEHERQTLIESRQELADQVASCKAALIDLDKLKMDVIEDLSHKRHGLRIDRSCLSPTKAVSTQERVVLPQLGEVVNYSAPPCPKDRVIHGCASTQEDARKDDTKGLLQRAVRMEEEAMKLCNESDAVMLQTKRECQRASAQAQTSIARRADETDDLKKKLEAQMREIDEAIAHTEMSLGKTKKKLESHEAPLKALDTQFKARGGRTSREGIRDHVHDEMEGHLESVKKSVRILTTNFQNTKSLLDSLKESRVQLTEDYRNKLLALKIEDACLKVTARKAMELDRMDPRGGRCKVPALKQSARGKEGGTYSLMDTMPMGS